ncbi:MAG: hypothetical protein HY602_02960 [Parcubacteria group bacterium]|nr:hypothetical protein [Parcubacteria group bacterium]
MEQKKMDIAQAFEQLDLARRVIGLLEREYGAIPSCRLWAEFSPCTEEENQELEAGITKTLSECAANPYKDWSLFYRFFYHKGGRWKVCLSAAISPAESPLYLKIKINWRGEIRSLSPFPTSFVDLAERDKEGLKQLLVWLPSEFKVRHF